ncbi:hypothetical protein O0I10_004885 [Lichtheimia ornata]|uniref:Uncharacterized protein n=1 Tax=Lichtheimia ornata TaxID=688661 RepID=A0AAD7V746_9FUNG|nr:uncharacterized protein O0I10_004885 [Lichtheimia ornata]KAJ8659520.1 hypothetical protein O0I10_004885 [Lichtheimia ornata]
MAILALAIACIISSTSALRLGEQCDATPLYTATWQYDDSCENIYLFCDPATNTCNYRGCTNSDYLQGWDTAVHPFPQRCRGDTYCPDDNSACKPKLQPGEKCQLQRDDECAGTNPICLNATCYIKAAPLGGACGADTTMYVTYDRDDYAIRQIIIRDNCTDGTYCMNEKCIESKENGATCEQDRECLSAYCNTDGLCVNGPDVFHTIPNWLWAVVGVAIVVFVLIILVLLWFLHRYQSRKEHAKITKFFGDNEEFAKYAMLENDDMPLVGGGQPAGMDSRTSVVYLATPDYNHSAALSTHAGRKSFRNSSTSRFLDSNVSLPAAGRDSGSLPPSRSQTPDRARTPDNHF